MALHEAGVPALVGGSHALQWHTGHRQDSREFGLFVRPGDARRALGSLAEAGFSTKLAFPRWLGRALADGDVVDIVFGTRHGVGEVDDEWFTHAVPGHVLGVRTWLCPPEELIWTRAFVMERERYEGADVAHLLQACGARLNWPRLLRRFDVHWRLLLSHLVLFGFVYPDDRAAVPGTVMADLLERLGREPAESQGEDPRYRGTLLSRTQSLADATSPRDLDPEAAPDGRVAAGIAVRQKAAIAEG